jgi:carboxypeptidase PM20D1
MVRRFIQALAIGLLGLLAVVLVRTMMTPPIQGTTQDSMAHSMEASTLKVVPSPDAPARLARAIRFSTISADLPRSTPAFEALLAQLRSDFPKIHAQLESKRFGHSLMFRWIGSESNCKPALLLGHLDVVPASSTATSGWTHPPFSGHIDDTYIWGRGTLDDKNSVLAILEAVTGLLEANFTPKCTVYLAFGQDEEINGLGAKAMAQYFENQSTRFDFVLDEGTIIGVDTVPGIKKPVALIAVAEKGSLTLRLRIEPTQGGHSSMPPRETPIGILAGAVSRLEKHPAQGHVRGVAGEMFAHLAPAFPFGLRAVVRNQWLFRPVLAMVLEGSPESNAFLRTTTAVTVFHAGVKDNVLPQSAEALVNFRILPGDTVASTIEYVRKTVADDRVRIEMVNNGWNPSRISDAKSRAYQRVAGAVQATFPDSVSAPALNIAATDSRHYEQLSDQVFRFMPVKFLPEDLVRFHGVNERISIEAYQKQIEFYHRLMQTL